MALSIRYYGFLLTHTTRVLKTTGILIEHRLFLFLMGMSVLFLFRIHQFSITRIQSTMLFLYASYFSISVTDLII